MQAVAQVLNMAWGPEAQPIPQVPAMVAMLPVQMSATSVAGAHFPVGWIMAASWSRVSPAKVPVQGTDGAGGRSEAGAKSGRSWTSTVVVASDWTATSTGAPKSGRSA